MNVLHAQLVIRPLGSNGLQEQVRQSTTYRINRLRSLPDTLELPFIEDFSYVGPGPDSSKWIDGGVYINSQYPVKPPSWGVATFDGLNAKGVPYSRLLAHGAADTLTSLPVNLQYPASDSIYLSFYYQPKGRGNFPEFVDTFLLEFKNPADTVWRWAWSSRGEDFPQTERPFRQVMIPIRDTAFLKKGFQFRFRNYAQLNGSWDHWHLDYIRLDRSRYRGDTITADVAFMYPATTLLKDYQSVPLHHFFSSSPASRMAELDTLSLFNNMVANVNRNYGYSFYNYQGTLVDETINTVGPIPPRREFPFDGIVKYVYQNPGPGHEWTIYRLQHFLKDNPDDFLPRNDTVEYVQVLGNYYALDDGSAEERIGMESDGGGFVAQRFDTYMGDTLKAIQYYFNRVNDGVIDRPFYVMVWGAGANQPGEIIVNQAVNYPDSTGLNSYSTFVLDRPVYLPAGSYYIGWAQEMAASLNLGFDRNLASNSRIYYNQDGTWYNYTAQQGTLMMRPLFRQPYDIYPGTPPVMQETAISCRVYPNPASGRLYIDRMNAQYGRNELLIEITDISGRMMYKTVFPGDRLEIPTGDWAGGIYFVAFRDRTEGRHMVRRIIVTH